MHYLLQIKVASQQSSHLETPDLLQTLTPVMMQQLEPIERYGLVDDTWASTLAGRTSAVAFVEFAQAFQDETDLDVWTALTTALAQIDRILDAFAALDTTENPAASRKA